MARAARKARTPPACFIYGIARTIAASRAPIGNACAAASRAAPCSPRRAWIVIPRRSHPPEQVCVEAARGQSFRPAAQRKEDFAGVVALRGRDRAGADDQPTVHLPELLRVDLRQ